MSPRGGRPMQFRGGLGLAFGALNQPQPNALAPLRITLIVAVVAVCWAGCSAARVTQPLPVGPDTYTVSARMPHGGAASAREAALSAANQQCARLSKQLLVLKSSTNIDFNENKDVVVVDVTFRCLATGDPAAGGRRSHAHPRRGIRPHRSARRREARARSRRSSLQVGHLVQARLGPAIDPAHDPHNQVGE